MAIIHKAMAPPFWEKGANVRFVLKGISRDLLGDSPDSLTPVWVNTQYTIDTGNDVFTVDVTDYCRVYGVSEFVGGLFSRVERTQDAYAKFLFFQVPQLIGSTTEQYAAFANSLNDLFVSDSSAGRDVVMGLWNDAYTLWDRYEGGYMGEFSGKYNQPGGGRLYFGNFTWDDGVPNTPGQARQGGFVLSVKETHQMIPETSTSVIMLGAFAWGMVGRRRRQVN